MTESGPSGGGGASAPAEEHTQPESRIPALDLERLRAQLSAGDQRLAELETEVAKRSRKWYREPAVIIALAALITSVVATGLSQASNATDRRFQQKTRLTSVVQQIYGAQAKVVEQRAQYGDKAPVPGSAEMVLLATEADGLMNDVDATPYEQTIVAQGFWAGSDYDRALAILKRAGAEAQTTLDKIVVGRQAGTILFAKGDSVLARQEFSRALEASGTPTATSSGGMKFFHFETQLQWASGELNAGNCQEAAVHSLSAQADLSLFPPSTRALIQPRTAGMNGAITAACR